MVSSTSLLLFLMCAKISLQTKSIAIDNRFFAAFHLFINRGTIRIALFFSFFGTGAFLIPAYILIVHFLNKLKYAKYAILIAVTALTSLLSGWLLKAIFHRHRPILPLAHEGGWYSFPSGHALGIFTFSGICIFLIAKMKLRTSLKCLFYGLFTGLACLVGLSRIFLHVHFATDVIGSLFFSVFWMSFMYLVSLSIYGTKLNTKNQIEWNFNKIAHGEGS